MHWRRKWQPTPVFLPGESQGRGSLVGCHLWGRTESAALQTPLSTGTLWFQDGSVRYHPFMLCCFCVDDYFKVLSCSYIKIYSKLEYLLNFLPSNYSFDVKIILKLLLLLLSHFSHVRLCATPSTAAHQAPPSLGFSRQEQWSGLPFPSPMQESEK